MNRTTKGALETLQSPYFFSKLRSVFSQTGLEGEQKAAIALFFVMASRFFSNPLRLFIRQKTEGSAKYIFQRVAQLLPSELSASIARRERWLAFKKSSIQRVVYIPPWDEVEATEEKADFEICENQLARVLPLQEEGRITEKKEAVETSFVCISAREMPELNRRSRWLTMTGE